MSGFSVLTRLRFRSHSTIYTSHRGYAPETVPDRLAPRPGTVRIPKVASSHYWQSARSDPCFPPRCRSGEPARIIWIGYGEGAGYYPARCRHAEPFNRDGAYHPRNDARALRTARANLARRYPGNKDQLGDELGIACPQVSDRQVRAAARRAEGRAGARRLSRRTG